MLISEESPILVNLNGGNLGRAPLLSLTSAEFPLVLSHVVEIFRGISKIKIGDLRFRHAFEFNVKDKEKIEFIISNYPLPKGVNFYTVDGRKLFDIRGPGGSITTSCIVYLITE